MGLQWKDCVGVCIDGATAMTGHTVSFHSRVRSASDSSITFTHCMIYQEALVGKKISPHLHFIVQNALKVLNFIKSDTLNTRLSAKLCDDMESDYNTLLLRTEVRWLSKSKALERLLLLQNKVKIFLFRNNSELFCHFYNPNWMMKLSYLAVEVGHKILIFKIQKVSFLFEAEFFPEYFGTIFIKIG